MKTRTVSYRGCIIKIEHKNIKTSTGSVSSEYVASIDKLPDCTEYQDTYNLALQLAKEDIDFANEYL